MKNQLKPVKNTWQLVQTRDSALFRMSVRFLADATLDKLREKINKLPRDKITDSWKLSKLAVIDEELDFRTMKETRTFFGKLLDKGAN